MTETRAALERMGTAGEAGAGSDFERRLLARLLEDSHAFQTRNRDWLRYPAPRSKRVKRWLRSLVPALAHRAGYTRRYYSTGSPWLAFVAAHLPELARLHDGLADERSRGVLLDVLAYRTLGPRHVKLRASWERFREAARTVDARHRLAARTVRLAAAPHWLHRYRWEGREGPLELDALPLNVVNTFLSSHYVYGDPAAPTVAPRPGDVVLDGGGCWGDTALWFADRVGPDGRVLTFEFVPENLGILRANLARNPRLAPRIEIVERALWDADGETLRFASDAGPGTAVGGGGDAEVRTVTIDGLVRERGLERVDFVKLDVEGAELPTLRGAVETLRRWRPRLALSAYHRVDDLVTIPRFVAELDLGYRTWLDHITIHAEETVLFAAPE